jgi:hypothetical protein
MLNTRALTATQELQTSLDVLIRGIQFGSALVRIESIVRLVVTRLVQCPEIVPHLRDVRIEPDRTRVCVEGVAILVDLVVQNSDGAPKGRVTAITINGLLIRFVRFWVFLLRHVATPE